jgi:hypothetical protein
MALYLGRGQKVKIATNKGPCRVKYAYTKPSTNNALLMSKDGYLLTDLNGLYLIPKEDK